MMLKRYLCLVISVFFFSLTSFADSLYDVNSTQVYGFSPRVIAEGDIVTVYVSESTSAVQQASTRTEKDARVGASLESSWEQISSLLGNETKNQDREYKFSGEDQFQGSGRTSRRSQVRGVVSSRVIEVLDNGNLFIEGVHRVKVNNELETIRVAGIVRPQDISATNSVFSYQIAEAEITVTGIGVVASKQNPGLMSKLVGWLF